MEPLALVRELGALGLAVWVIVRLETRWVPVLERLLEYLIRAEAREVGHEVHEPEILVGPRGDARSVGGRPVRAAPSE